MGSWCAGIPKIKLSRHRVGWPFNGNTSLTATFSSIIKFLCKVCRLNTAGREYIGQVNTTVTGRQCQRWTSDTPHVPSSSYTDSSFPDGNLAAVENYCRNPDPSWLKGVWCYTMDPDTRWEECDVPECGKSVSAAGLIFFCITRYIVYNQVRLWSNLGQSQ